MNARVARVWHDDHPTSATGGHSNIEKPTLTSKETTERATGIEPA
jgi:hypothetical protein